MKKGLFLIPILGINVFSANLTLDLKKQDVNISKPSGANIRVEVLSNDKNINDFKKQLEKLDVDLKFVNSYKNYEESKNVETIVTFLSDKKAQYADGYEYDEKLKEYKIVYKQRGSKENNLKMISERVKKEKVDLKFSNLVHKKYDYESQNNKSINVYNLNVKNILNINKIVDVINKYDLNMETPIFYSDNTSNSYLDFKENSLKDASKIASFLGFNDLVRYEMEEYANDYMYNFENTNLRLYANKSAAIITPDIKEAKNFKNLYVFKNDNKKEYKNKISIISTAKGSFKYDYFDIEILEKDNSNLENLKKILPSNSKIETKLYYTYNKKEALQSEALKIAKLELKNLTNKNFDKIINYDFVKENFSISAKNILEVENKVEKISKELQKYGINVLIKSIDDGPFTKYEMKKVKHHSLNIRVFDSNDIEKVINYALKNNFEVKNIECRVNSSEFETKIKIEALKNAKLKLEKLGNYEIEKVEQLNMPYTYYNFYEINTNELDKLIKDIQNIGYEYDEKIKVTANLEK